MNYDVQENIKSAVSPFEKMARWKSCNIVRMSIVYSTWQRKWIFCVFC